MSFRSLVGVFVVAAVCSMCCVETAVAQRGGMARVMGGNNQFGLLMNKQVQEELELVDDQVRELEDLQKEMEQVVRDMFSEMQDLPRDQMREGWRDMREKMQEKMKPFEGRVKEVLMPHQHDRLKQLGYQNRARGQGAGGALQNQDLLDELEVTDEQKEKLDEALKEAREELQKQYAKLVKDAEEDVLKVLDSEQRKKYRELVGDPFQFENRNAQMRRFGAERGGDDRRNRGDR